MNENIHKMNDVMCSNPFMYAVKVPVNSFNINSIKKNFFVSMILKSSKCIQRKVAFYASITIIYSTWCLLRIRVLQFPNEISKIKTSLFKEKSMTKLWNHKMLWHEFSETHKSFMSVVSALIDQFAIFTQKPKRESVNVQCVKRKKKNWSEKNTLWPYVPDCVLFIFMYATHVQHIFFASLFFLSFFHFCCKRILFTIKFISPSIGGQSILFLLKNIITLLSLNHFDSHFIPIRFPSPEVLSKRIKQQKSLQSRQAPQSCHINLTTSTYSHGTNNANHIICT